MQLPPPQSSTTLVVLLGASEWPHCESLQGRNGDIFARSCDRLRQYVLSSQGLNLPAENLLDLFDDSQPASQITERISQFLRARAVAKPADVVVYYVGHGGCDSAGDYCLYLRSTRSQTLKSSGLSIDGLAEVLKEDARHLRHYIILDACLSGRAQGAAWQSAQGVSLLCSSSRHLNSKAPTGATYTLFTGALLRALTQADGDPGPAQERWTLRELNRRAGEQILRFADKKVLCEVHSPIQAAGDLADLPLFPPIRELSPENEILLQRHHAEMLEARQRQLEDELRAFEQGRWVERSITLVFWLVVACVAWQVWPTPYVASRDGQNRPVSDRRVHRLTGAVQQLDPVTGAWLDVGTPLGGTVNLEEYARLTQLKQAIDNAPDRGQRLERIEELRQAIAQISDSSWKAREQQSFELQYGLERFRPLPAKP